VFRPGEPRWGGDLMVRYQPSTSPAAVAFCRNRQDLLDDFVASVQQLLELQRSQIEALIHGDPDFERFDVLIHVALERKDEAKYALMAHVDSHQCEGAP
jgi:hypothetical protein